jgi:hypothetical protein
MVKSNITAREAFKLVYGHITFTKKDPGGREYYGEASGTNAIDIYGFYSENYRNKRFIVHELGHIFGRVYSNFAGLENQWSEGSPYADMAAYGLSRPNHGNKYTGFFGFAGGRHEWQFCLPEQTDYPGENFADSFLGWVYGKFENSVTGNLRRQHMGKHMQKYLGLYVSRADLEK